MDPSWSLLSPFDLTAALSQYPIGQQRTSGHKQFVILTPEYAYKGPFTATKISTIQNRVQWLRFWLGDTSVVLLPDPVVLPLASDPSKYFLRYRNLSTANQTNQITRFHQEKFSNYSYQVQERSNLVKLSDVVTQSAVQAWLQAQVKDLTLAWLALFILGTGDTCFSNALIDLTNQRAWLIDYDENRTVDWSQQDNIDKLGPFFYLSAPPAKAKQDFWLQQVSLVTPQLIEMVSQWPVPAGSEILKEIVLSKLSQINTTMVNGLVQTRPTTSVSTKTSYLAQLRSGRSHSNLPVDELKSGLQKYIRRGLVDQAVLCGWELWELGGPVRSNLLNRLMIIAAEDIGAANWPLVIATIRTCQSIKDIKAIEVDANTSNSIFFDQTLPLITNLANSSKTRLASQLWRTFCHPQGTVLANQRGLKVPLWSQHSLELAAAWFSSIVARMQGYWTELDPLILRYYGELFYHSLSQGDCNCLAYLGQYLASEDLKVAPRSGRRRTKPITVIWDLLKQFLPAEQITVLELAESQASREGLVFLKAAVVRILCGPDWSPGPSQNSYLTLSHHQLLDGEYQLVLDDFVIDKHTKAGRNQGKDRTEFVTVGAVVTNEDSRLDCEIPKWVYEHS